MLISLFETPPRYNIFPEPRTTCSDPPYRKRYLDRGEAEYSVLVFNSFYNVVMDSHGGCFNTGIMYINGLICFGSVVCEHMSVTVVTSSTFNRFWDKKSNCWLSQIIKLLGSNPSFFRSDFKIVTCSFRISENAPDDKDALIMFVISRTQIPVLSWRPTKMINERCFLIQPLQR